MLLGRVERLRHRDEGHIIRVERLDKLGEVGERAGQPIDLVDDDHVHPALFHFGQEEPQGRTLERSAGKAAIVVVCWQKPPALMGLTLYI
jgi:hypothetical protein